MRRAIVLMALLLSLPGMAWAGRSTASMTVGVTVVAACPAGSGKVCAQASPSAKAAAYPTAALSGPPESQAPILVLRDESARMVTFVY